MRNSFALCGSCVDGMEENGPHKGESRASSSSRDPSFLLSFPSHLRYIYGLAVSNVHTIFYKPRGTSGGVAMTFEEILDQAIAMLQRRGRLTYGTLKRQFQLDAAALEDLKNELIKGQRLAVDEDGEVLVWTGEPGTAAPAIAQAETPAQTPLAYTPPYLAEKILTSRSALEGERKQVTVLFADLKGSTELIPRPRSGSRPTTPLSGPAAHDGRRAPGGRHGEPGAG